MTDATLQQPKLKLPPKWQQFYALMKPRVIQLIVFCALIGMVLAVPQLPTPEQAVLMLLFMRKFKMGDSRIFHLKNGWKHPQPDRTNIQYL